MGAWGLLLVAVCISGHTLSPLRKGTVKRAQDLRAAAQK
jgi:hypothetical protein